MTPANLLIIMSDEHNPKCLGSYGHPLVKTPHLDGLAAQGTRFTTAYTNCPVCVPARASFATGKYLHQVGFWDNADPYDGSVESWHHRVRAAGLEAVAIGKLHYRSADEDHGFTREILPMNVVENKGDLMGLVRDKLPRRKGAWKMAGQAGPGESSYTIYDRRICAEAQKWLYDKAASAARQPWALFVSFVAPHFPLIAPPEHYYRYYNADDPLLPKLYDPKERPRHPYLAEYAASFDYDSYFDGPDAVRRAIAGYYGLCSFLDENIGRVLAALKDAGLAGNTRVLYLSDHGDNLGARGLWGKSTMYEESVGVPMIMAGPDIPAGRVCTTPVSLVDVHATVLDGLGLPPPDPGEDFPGRSLFEVATAADGDRLVFSEYHGMGSTAGFFMLRDARWKYVHYVHYPPQLFDLRADPEELNDLAGDPAYAGIVATFRERLHAICDPAEVDRRAKARQAELLQLNGGRDAVIARGDLGYSPPPGASAEFAA